MELKMLGTAYSESLQSTVRGRYVLVLGFSCHWCLRNLLRGKENYLGMDSPTS